MAANNLSIIKRLNPFSKINKKQKLARAEYAKYIKSVNGFAALATGNGLSMSDFAMAGDTDVNYLKKEHYLVRAMILLLMRSVSQIDWKVVTESGGIETEVARDHEYAKLIRRPNPFTSTSQMMAAIAGYRSVDGNAFIAILKNKLSNKPLELWVHNSDTIGLNYRIGRNGNITGLAGYMLRANNGLIYKIKLEDMMHVKNHSLSGLFLGESDLMAALEVGENDRALRNWQKTTMTKGAFVSGILAVKNLTSKKQLEDLYEILDDHAQGGEREGEDMILSADLDYHKISQSTKDLDIVKSQNLTAKHLVIAYGLNAIVLGETEGASLNNAHANVEHFWNNRIAPIAKAIEDSFNHDISPYFGDNIYLRADMSKIPAMINAVISRIEAYVSLVRNGVKPIGAINMLGIPLSEQYIYDGFLGDYAQETAFLNNVGAEQYQNIIQDAVNKALDSSQTKAEDNNAAKYSTNDGKIKLWAKADRLRQAWESDLEKDLSKLFKDEGNDISEAVIAGVGLEFTVNQYEVKRLNLLRDYYKRGLDEFGKVKFDEIIKGTEYENVFAVNSDMLNFIEAHTAKQVKFISETTVKKLENIIQKAFTDGLSSSQTAKLIKDNYKVWAELSRNYNKAGTFSRAGRIARTETGMLASYSKEQAGEVFTKTYNKPLVKIWLNSGDERVRPEHIDVGSEVVPWNSIFSNGLRYPLDPLGPANQVVDCRCDFAIEIDDGSFF